MNERVLQVKMVSINSSNPENYSKSEKVKSPHNQIKHLIAVMSSKGGVGKSFVTGLLASELTRDCYKVGILDADFTGSSIPMFFGLHGPVKTGQYSVLPLESRSGIKIISANLLFDDEGQSIIWKESLAGKVVEELWKEVEWGPLDYLLVDMPPATSEIAIAIMKSLPIMGGIIVTTPQGIAAKIVSKAIYMAQNIGVQLIGVVENMAYYLNPDTGQEQFLFGQCRGESVANGANVPLLAQLPLDPMVAKLCDLGNIEDVILNESSGFIESFLESLSDLEEKVSSFIPEIQSTDIEFSGNNAQMVEKLEVSNTTDSPSPQNHVVQPFSETVIHLVRSKDNVGTLEHPDAQGNFLGKCGDRMQIDLQIISGRILEARFLADGCGATLACGSMITKMACAKTLDEASKISADDLISALDGLPNDHLHCADLAVMTLREALIDAIEGH